MGVPSPACNTWSGNRNMCNQQVGCVYHAGENGVKRCRNKATVPKKTVMCSNFGSNETGWPSCTSLGLQKDEDTKAALVPFYMSKKAGKVFAAKQCCTCPAGAEHAKCKYAKGNLEMSI